MKNIGIILAGGSGSRFKGDKPKQYYIMAGKELIAYSIEAFLKSKNLDDFIVVVDKAEMDAGRIRDSYNVKTILGGSTRNGSLKNALDYIHEHYPNCEKIIENNAACPLVQPQQIDDILALLDEYDYVQTTFKITDALGSYSSRTVNREDFFLIQSPDAYRFPLLYKHFSAEHPNGHPAVQLPEESRGYNYMREGQSFKVTYPDDIEIGEIMLKRLYDTETF